MYTQVSKAVSSLQFFPIKILYALSFFNIGIFIPVTNGEEKKEDRQRWKREETNIKIGFEVLTAVSTKMAVFKYKNVYSSAIMKRTYVV
jgi:hypothetical protein